MKQSKLNSLLEQILSVGSGFLLSVLIVQPLVFPIFGIYLDMVTNISVAVIFTIVSIARGYITRRLFNWWHHKEKDIRFLIYNKENNLILSCSSNIKARLKVLITPGAYIKTGVISIYPQ